MANKYELLNAETKDVTITNDDGTTTTKTLKRIRALKDFADIQTGDKGGYVESTDNLSQDGNCWIYRGIAYGNAEIHHNARLYHSDAVLADDCKIYDNVVMNGKMYGDCAVADNAFIDYGPVITGLENTDRRPVWIGGNTLIYGSVRITGNLIRINHYAKVYGNAKLTGSIVLNENAQAYGNCRISGSVVLEDNVQVYGSAVLENYHPEHGWTYVSENAQLYGHCYVSIHNRICGNSKIYGRALIRNHPKITDNVEIYGKAVIGDCAVIRDNSKVSGNVEILGFSEIIGDSVITGNSYINISQGSHNNGEGTVINDEVLDNEIRR